MTDSIETAMKQHGLELDNGYRGDAYRFMKWTADGWLVFQINDYTDATIYQGDDLGRALAALIGEQP